MASGVVSLSTLLDSLLQKSYHELTVLAELLPRKSDVDRKTEIVQFARRTRLQLVRLLALVKWAGSSDSVQKCSEMSELVSHQSWLYEDTANQLVQLARHQLLQACMPNFSLAPALDILCTSSYPRLPSCIHDNIIPPSPLEGEEGEEARALLTRAVSRRLLLETIPPAMTVKSIDKGLVTFEVPHEFSLSLSVISEDHQMPWRLVQLRVLVAHSLPSCPPLLHSQQLTFLTQLVQSHLVTRERPLSEVFSCLHTFCLSLQLDCLHSQAVRLVSMVTGGYVRVEEYQPGRCLRLSYWCTPPTAPSSFGGNKKTGGSSPKLLITINSSSSSSSSSSSRPLSCSHQPPLPEDSEAVEVGVERLCLEEVIGDCVRVRSHARLARLRASLDRTVWEDRVSLISEPLYLRVCVPVKGEGEGCVRKVVVSVDRRLGQVVVGVEPVARWDSVAKAVEEVEKALLSSSDLSSHLTHLQSQLFLDQIFACSEELGLRVESSLPLSSPLPLPLLPSSSSPSHTLFIQLIPSAYLVVCVRPGGKEGDGGGGDVGGNGGGGGGGAEVIGSYYLLELTEAAPPSGVEAASHIPQIFLCPLSLVEIDSSKLLQESLRAIVVKCNAALLKRKLRDGDHALPSTKRVCVVGQLHFPALPPLITSHLTLHHLKSSLHTSGINGYQILHSTHGCPSLSVYSFPLLEGESPDLHHHLSSLLLSCLIFPSPLGHKLVMTFSPLISVDLAPEVVLHQDLPLTFDLGQSLLALWRSKLLFLSLALELLHYLDDPEWPLSSSCSLSHFGYDSFTITFGEHSLSAHGGVTALQLSFSAGCPHTFLAESLQHCLLTTHSLPLLLKGIFATEEIVSLLVQFEKRFSGASLVALSPAQVQLHYDNLSLSLNMLTGLRVEFTDLVYTRQNMFSLPGTPNILGYLKAFFHTFLGSDDPAEVDDAPATPLPRPLPGKPSLQPSPLPISSPSRGLWPSSPLPSIPQLPTPPSHPHHFTASPSSAWSHIAALEQLRRLLTPPTATPTSCSPLRCFLSSLAQLCQFWYQASIERTQQPPPPLQFLSVDRGTYHFRTETLALSISIEMNGSPSLQLALKCTRDGCWSPQELATITEFFMKEVASPPYATLSIVCFLRLLHLPTLTLHSCVEMMDCHLNPPPNLPWCLSLCLVIPPGVDSDIAQLKPGTPGVYYKTKLLIMVQLTRTQDGHKLLIPVMHDIRSNTTFTSRQQLHSVLTNVDNVLKKASHELTKSSNPEVASQSTLFPAVRVVLGHPHLVP